MNCSKIHKKLALLQELTPDEKLHVRTCPACTEFSKNIKLLAIKRAATTPEDLKHGTLALCRHQFADEKRSTRPYRSDNNLIARFFSAWHSPKAAIALSVLSVFVLVGAAITQFYCDQSNIFCRLSAAFLLIVLLQNVVTAICVPILLQNKFYLKFKF